MVPHRIVIALVEKKVVLDTSCKTKVCMDKIPCSDVPFSQCGHFGQVGLLKGRDFL